MACRGSGVQIPLAPRMNNNVNDEREHAAYDFAYVQEKWLPVWDQLQPFKSGRADDTREKKYVLDMFPYPSGDLHMGHAEAYALGDVIARYWAQKGFNVMHPIGWDAFGLPTENYAIKNKIHPRVATDENITNFRRQLKSIGFSFDWSREIDTTDPDYYKWTQYIFLKLFEKGLAYKKQLPIKAR